MEHPGQCLDDLWRQRVLRRLHDAKQMGCFDVAISCRNVIKTGCPYAFTCADKEGTEEDKSSTDNCIVVFDLSQPGPMKEIGRVRIGEPHEVITSVHFGDDFSYATQPLINGIHSMS